MTHVDYVLHHITSMLSKLFSRCCTLSWAHRWFIAAVIGVCTIIWFYVYCGLGNASRVLFSVSCKISYTKSFMGWVCRYMHCARTYIECITYPNISTIHSYISTPAQHATRPSVLVCVMIYAGGKNNVIPHTTGLTTRLSSSCVSITFHLYYNLIV